jgi:senataxin
MALTTEQQTSHLSRLQREVLGWDYFTMGDGSIDRSGKDKGKQSKLKDVPNTFKDVNEYLSIFQPLVLEECAAQITRGDDDDESVSREGGASTIGAVFKTSRVDGFHVVQFILGEDAMRRFHDNDLILVSKTHPHEEIPVPEGCFDPDASAEKADAKNDDVKKT